MERADMALDDAAKAAQAELDARQKEQKQQTWDANWARLRGMKGVAPTGPAKSGKGPRLAPGERVVVPEA